MGRYSQERKKADKKRRFMVQVFDFSLGFFGLLLAAASAYFPWYVYTHSDEYQPPRMVFDPREELPGANSQPPVLAVQRERNWKDLGPNIDPTATGSIELEDDENPTKIPFKRNKLRSLDPTVTGSVKQPQNYAQSDLQLVFVSKNRALVKDGEDLIPVAVGSVLPDGKTIQSFVRRDGGWEMLTK